MELQPDQARRLGFIRYVFGVAVSESNKPQPASAASVLAFHDAIELFLQLASEHLDAGGQQPSFMEYWELISGELPDPLPQKEAMRRLNRARVALKHHGTRPSKSDIESFRATARSFFEEACPLVFGVSFFEVSMAEFVEPESARERLVAAQSLLEEGEIAESVEQSAIAFRIILDDYEDRKRNRWGRSPFYFGRDLQFLDSFFMGLGNRRGELMASQSLQRDLAKFIDRVQESVEAMQEAIKMLALRVDYPRYSRFSLLTPHVVRRHDGEYEIHRRRDEAGDQLDQDDAAFCIDFVIDTALSLQEFDYTIEIEE